MGKSPNPIGSIDKALRALRIFDFAGAGGSILWGVHLALEESPHSAWPWAWILGGLAGTAFAYWNGAQRLLNFLVSRVKRPAAGPSRAVRGYPAPPSAPFRPK